MESKRERGGKNILYNMYPFITVGREPLAAFPGMYYWGTLTSTVSTVGCTLPPGHPCYLLLFYSSPIFHHRHQQAQQVAHVSVQKKDPVIYTSEYRCTSWRI